MSQPANTTMQASNFINTNDHRRGMIPTPAGALPSPRRRRRGLVDMSAWDAAVEAENRANGTQSISGQFQTEPEPDPARQSLPDAPQPEVPRNPTISSGAILEDSQPEMTPPTIILPTPQAAALAAAKTALANEEARQSNRVPPPPTRKRATKTAKS